jgi:hypothetical protein
MQADHQLLRDVQLFCDEESRGIVAETIVSYCSACAQNSRLPELSTECRVREEADNLNSLLSYLRMRKFAVGEEGFV